MSSLDEKGNPYTEYLPINFTESLYRAGVYNSVCQTFVTCFFKIVFLNMYNNSMMSDYIYFNFMAASTMVTIKLTCAFLIPS